MMISAMTQKPLATMGYLPIAAMTQTSNAALDDVRVPCDHQYDRSERTGFFFLKKRYLYAGYLRVCAHTCTCQSPYTTLLQEYMANQTNRFI